VDLINNDNVHQSLEVIFGGKDIHSSLGVAGGKVENFPLNMCSTLQSNSYDKYPKVCCGLLYIHSYRGTKTNGNLDHQWYDHYDIMKGGQL